MNGYALILGAGASKGALVGAKNPPLDTDFLATARRELSGKGRRDAGAKAWREFCKALKTAGLKEKEVIKGRLEILSTYLEARANMPAIQASAGKPADYAEALKCLIQVICFTLMRTGGTSKCSLHKVLFELVQPSCVVTFNYDLISDQTLLNIGRLSWAKMSYCGSTITVKGKSGNRYSRVPPSRRFRNAIPLLKLHGSMHWQAHQRGDSVSLCVDDMPGTDFKYSEPPITPLIVPPVASKITIQKGHLRKLWTQAAKHLRQAPGWIIWGYSFPRTDTVTQMLCRVALSRNKKPKPVIVINPDPSVLENVKTSLTKIRPSHYMSIERFLLDHKALRIS